jgi:hypothetical protein
MIKRISCRVIRSVPLGRNSGTFQRARWSNNKYHRVYDTAAADAGQFSSPPTNTSQFNKTRASAESDLKGKFLDYYA